MPTKLQVFEHGPHDAAIHLYAQVGEGVGMCDGIGVGTYVGAGVGRYVGNSVPVEATVENIHSSAYSLHMLYVVQT